ncbi:MAG: prephenate dehydrogenase/arogenate dehydrogenase family protein [Methylobacillus sp.]|jgi:prephenate dehydrogenase|nr:prephenate dehydrogenase/arogenate dehydrogenase family protein [Methylobacillus sp.]
MFDKLVIAGVGLIGGSVALAARRGKLARRIVGIGRADGSINSAIALGVIDAAEAPEQAANADLIVLAMPVGQMPGVMAELRPHLGAKTLITDAGSTKGDVVAAAREHLGDALPRFIPGHPIAGAEKSGVAAATAELFDDKNVVLTPLAENAAADVNAVADFWRACGAKVSEMPVEAHDKIFAAISHLPHVLAFALVGEIARRPDADQLFAFAAGGFRDFTRIAGSSPEMWRDICLANRPALLAEMDAYAARLQQMRELIDTQDGAALADFFEHARAARNAWANARGQQ